MVPTWCRLVFLIFSWFLVYLKGISTYALLTLVSPWQSDFRLMCSNAMAYNRADTIYFKAAKRLLHIGTKVRSQALVVRSRRPDL